MAPAEFDRPPQKMRWSPDEQEYGGLRLVGIELVVGDELRCFEPMVCRLPDVAQRRSGWMAER